MIVHNIIHIDINLFKFREDVDDCEKEEPIVLPNIPLEPLLTSFFKNINSKIMKLNIISPMIR